MRSPRPLPRLAPLFPALLVLFALALAVPPPSPAVWPSAGEDGDAQVLVVSVDGLNPRALERLGRAQAPHLWRLVDEGAATLEARTQRELTTTLPNHTSMVTGRRIDAARGGHGVTWNVHRRGTTVQRAAGHGVGSMFSVAHRAGVSTALFAAKTKFSLFRRSWPTRIDRTTIREGRDADLVTQVRRDLLAHDRGLTMLHLSAPDVAGHAHGFMGPAYLDAVRAVDALLGQLLADADGESALDDLTVVLTADHGGAAGASHHEAVARRANYRVPFVVWGPGIAPADLYAINPGYRHPGTGRPALTGRQPVRNGDVANLALRLLGLDPVPGSQFGVTRPLQVR